MEAGVAPDDEPPPTASLLVDEPQQKQIPTPKSVLGWFWLLGVLNNSSYVIMIASAKEINAGGVALVYICAVGAGLCTKASAPWWFDCVSYGTRLAAASCAMLLSFLLVGPVGRGVLPLQLAGVLACSVQSALGEASLLALASRHAGRGASAVAAWSSGTGFAGILGYAWVWLLTSPQGPLGLGLAACQALAAATLPACYAASARAILHAAPPGSDGAVAPRVVELTGAARLKFALSLWPTTGAIFVVYFSEYAMQSGVWAAMGFPRPNTTARRANFYLYSNWLYQCGVLVSRSSGFLVKTPPELKTLWAMSLSQALLLAFFAADAARHFWYDASMLGACFAVGLFGGAVYVHSFRRLAARDELAELAMPIGALASDAGTLCSNVAGLFLQACLYEANRIDGATVGWKLPGCAAASE